MFLDQKKENVFRATSSADNRNTSINLYEKKHMPYTKYFISRTIKNTDKSATQDGISVCQFRCQGGLSSSHMPVV